MTKYNPDYGRYTRFSTGPVTVTSIEADGKFFKYVTKSGHNLYSKFDHKLTMNTATEMLINYDTKFARWRLVEVK